MQISNHRLQGDDLKANLSKKDWEYNKEFIREHYLNRKCTMDQIVELLKDQRSLRDGNGKISGINFLEALFTTAITLNNSAGRSVDSGSRDANGTFRPRDPFTGWPTCWQF
ncbi:hypothetical protein TWF751_002934 [Orbilia oligospora]|nr:hypothetical protein TWF751_002934 [Orbilia oligospora]